MSAVTMWVRSRIRRDWRALVVIALTVAVTVGLTMTAAIGARRAGGAWGQFLERTKAPDLLKEVPVANAPAELDRLRAIPGVTSATSMGYIGVAPELYVPARPSLGIGGFTGLSPGFGTEVNRPIVLQGRLADPTKVEELTVTRKMAELTGLGPGDSVALVSDPAAVHQTANVVGITVSPLDTAVNGGSAMALLTPAFGAKWFDASVEAYGPQAQASYPVVMMVRAASKSTRSKLIDEGYEDGFGFSGSEISVGLGAEHTAYTVLSAAAALGSAIALGQLIARRVRRDAHQISVFAALGLTPGRRWMALGGAHSVAALAGVMMSPGIAYVASPVLRRELVGVLDPKGHHVIDVVVVAIAMIGGAVVLVGVPVWAAWRADVSSRQDRRTGRVGRVQLPGPAGLFGVRVAAGWGDRSDRIVARSSRAMLAVGVAVVVAVSVWSSASRYLVNTPSSFGATWDAAVTLGDVSGDLDPLTALDDAQQRLDADPAIGLRLGRGVAAMAKSSAVPGSRVEILQIDRPKGPWWPKILRGRVPRAANEITVGGVFIDSFHDLGDEIDIEGRTFTIVGEHLVSNFSNGNFGETIAMEISAVPITSLLAPTAVMWVELSSGATADDLAGAVGDGVDVQSAREARPGNVSNLARVGRLVELLTAVSILLAVATLANGLLLATRSRQRDHATMRALGADRVTIARSVHCHTGIVVAFGALAGIPLGFVAGAATWRHTAQGLPVDDSLRRPGVTVLVVLAGVVVAGVMVAWTGGWAAGRRSRQWPATQ